nr:hypothetical protein [Micromonospora sp. DSM 115978]
AAELRGLVDETLPAVRRLAPRSAGASAGTSASAPASTPADGSGGADRLTYTLEVDGPGGRTVRTFSEPVPDDVRPLVEVLRKAPLLPARREAR